jgi:hypothetical protein
MALENMDVINELLGPEIMNVKSLGSMCTMAEFPREKSLDAHLG